MFTSRTHRRTVTCAILCALVASAPAGTAAASPDQDARTAAALAQERYYSSSSQTPPADPSVSAALAQERYFSSYGSPQRPTQAQPTVPAGSDDYPWIPLGLPIAAALAIATATATRLRRLRLKRRHTARAAA